MKDSGRGFASVHVLGLGALVLVAALVIGVHAAFAQSKTASRIAFSSTRDGNAEIYVMNADGSNPIRLTKVSSPDYAPAFSPDGSRIAFVSERDGNAEIYVMNADGSNPIRLTKASGADADPAWSADGRRIAFASNRDGAASEIYVMNADGSGQTRVTKSTGRDANPTWSPDGTRVAFTSFREGLKESVWTTALDGANQVNITRSKSRDFSPAWSPDGKRMAFVSDRDGGEEIYVMNADGSGPARLTNHKAKDLSPSWSPDGSAIAFSSNRDGNDEIYVMAADGSAPTRLTKQESADQHPAWGRAFVATAVAPAPTPTRTPVSVTKAPPTATPTPTPTLVRASGFSLRVDPPGDTDTTWRTFSGGQPYVEATTLSPSGTDAVRQHALGIQSVSELTLGGPVPGTSDRRGRLMVFTNNFQVDLPGFGTNVVRVHIEPVVIPAQEDADSGALGFKTYGPGQPVLGEITLSLLSEQGNYSAVGWWQGTIDGDNVLRDFSVSLLTTAGEPARTYNFFNCFPTSYTPFTRLGAGETGSALVETITVLCDLVLFGNAGARQQLMAWLTDLMFGADDPSSIYRNLSVLLLDRTGVAFRTFQYLKAFPTKYVFPDLDANEVEVEAIEQVSFQPESADFGN